MKYGRKTDDYTRPKLDLTALVAEGDFSMVPATQENLSVDLRAKLQMLGNDVAGDCEPVRWANHRLLMTGNYPDNVMSGVWSLYQTQNPQFNPNGDPNVDGPGSPADQGMSTDELLDYLHKNGGPDGVKVVAYGTIDPRNVQAVERAIALFGAVWVDILVQPGNQQEFSQGSPWTNTGEAPEGSHAVLSAGFVPQRRIVTWADETTLDESFWTGSTQEGPLVERVYLPIWPEHATKEFIASQGAEQLAADYKALTGKDLAWPTTPAPSTGGTSFLVSDPTVLAHIATAAARKNVTPEVWITRHFDRYFRIADMMADELI